MIPWLSKSRKVVVGMDVLVIVVSVIGFVRSIPSGLPWALMHTTLNFPILVAISISFCTSVSEATVRYFTSYFLLSSSKIGCCAWDAWLCCDHIQRLKRGVFIWDFFATNRDILCLIHLLLLAHLRTNTAYAVNREGT